ncbi:MAG: hypothetical protein RBR78_03460 [Flavobacteriaceae bacterium]|jgi:hypothetical protein|nr:hypothetical protein [Flavobacteriaceae bacterium]
MNDLGSYWIKGRKLTIKSEKTFCGWSAGVFAIISLSVDGIVLADNNGKELHLKKMK